MGIMLTAIRNIAIVGGGFIITLGGGKRICLHVYSKEALLEWVTSLARGAGGGSGPRNAHLIQMLQREDMDGETAALATAKPGAKSLDWIPRVATLATKARLPAPRKTIFSERALGKQFACNTHPAAVMRDLNKDYAAVFTARVHPANEVTDKIGNSSDCQMWPRFPKGVLADARLVGKVTDHSRESLEEGASTRAMLT